MRRLAGNGPLETRKVTEARVLLPLGEGLNSFKIYSILFNSRVRPVDPQLTTENGDVYYSLFPGCRTIMPVNATTGLPVTIRLCPSVSPEERPTRLAEISAPFDSLCRVC